MSIFTDNAVIENGLTNPSGVELSDGTNALGTAINPLRSDPTGTTTQPISATSLPLPANAAQETGGHLASIDNKLTAPIQTITALASTSTITQVTTVNNTNTQLLAANPNRKKAILFVDHSTNYIKLGVTASATSFTYKVTSNNTAIEITGWTGEIDIFGSAATVTITELS